MQMPGMWEAVVTQTQLTLTLFGSCRVRINAPSGLEVKGRKSKALFVLLATAPNGQRSRKFLQEMLWGPTDYDSGYQNLRQALSKLRRDLGSYYADILEDDHSSLTLKLDPVMIEPCSGVGEFLEDLTLQGTKFDLWLQRLRANPAEIDELLGSSPPAVPASLTPTIAAIPFRLVQGDKTHRFLGDWLAEEICRVMSRSRLLSVISHLSTRSFANRAFDIAGIRRDLKVDYCLVGSIRVSGDRIALNVDLIDTKTGRILWDREFESSIDAIRNLSDCMGQIVSVAVGRTIVKESIAAALSAQPSEVDT